ncbi:hemerythrin [Actinoplanes philippinensis]|uniref:Hemerythrin HHE cation binding domain-containing protein n=1 Tax=Actinoplanes philippinensis TaxID=35752 RepID=A0A1I2DE81_9ACTN|nr:hemerythrin domain-containing protein [Actinoplanes philippinensis]GIE74301.1 hemerythrin [Actinoplanes philippinensis]SFE78817.1 Hemerythrin HHE cation binding domain-containing protein [Actinoplanes philippinensis]
MTTVQKEQDVIELLLSQHQQIKALFTRVNQSTGEQKRDAFHELTRLLAVHESAEEQVVHPAARDDAGDAVVEARLEEENMAKRALADLYDLGVDSPDFDVRFAGFEAAVLSHALHEEQEEFPQLRTKTDPDRLIRMAGAVRAAEAVSPTRPHPNAGENPVANLIAGPPLAIFDKARDAVRDWRQSHND